MARHEPVPGRDPGATGAQIMGFLAAELARLTDDVAAIEAALSDVVIGGCPLAPHVRRRLQDIDRVRQSAESLARLASVVNSGTVAPEALAAAIRLGAMRGRLAAQVPGAAPPEDPRRPAASADGAVEFFGPASG